jgi:hypothetical protein
MRTALGAIIAVAGASASHGASAEQMVQFFSGQSLSALCERSVDECTGYVLGVYDTLATLHNASSISDDTPYVCVPPTAKDVRLTLIVAKYLDDHPAERHSGAPKIVIAALAKAFPCKARD